MFFVVNMYSKGIIWIKASGCCENIFKVKINFEMEMSQDCIVKHFEHFNGKMRYKNQLLLFYYIANTKAIVYLKYGLCLK